MNAFIVSKPRETFADGGFVVKTTKLSYSRQMPGLIQATCVRLHSQSKVSDRVSTV